ncbi:MAG: hypothetical protein AAGF93_02920 [Cyanobacteria bacterium P01_H01_bin.105]
MLDTHNDEKVVQTLASDSKYYFQQSPKFEGANIIDGIGFKHVTYMAEEAILQYFKAKELGIGMLYKTYGLGFEVVGSSIRIPKLVRLDDSVRIQLKPILASDSLEQAFSIEMLVNSEVAVSSTLKVLFRRVRDVPAATDLPEALKAYVVSDIDRYPLNKSQDSLAMIASKQSNNIGSRDSSSLSREVTGVEDAIIQTIAPKEENNFAWKWHIPYFYCHYSKWMQHSGYLRLIEEVVDLFLKARGISIWSMLESHAWIPFVSQAEVELWQDAFMEETIYTVYTVEKVVKDFLYTSRVDFYVVRGDKPIQTARGRITHGYARLSDNPEVFELARFDQKVLNALHGRK